MLDSLGEALNLLRLSETTYFHGEFSAPGGLVTGSSSPQIGASVN